MFFEDCNTFSSLSFGFLQPRERGLEMCALVFAKSQLLYVSATFVYQVLHVVPHMFFIILVFFQDQFDVGLRLAVVLSCRSDDVFALLAGNLQFVAQFVFVQRCLLVHSSYRPLVWPRMCLQSFVLVSVG